MPLLLHGGERVGIRSYTLGLAVFATLLAFVVLNRWAFTMLGFESFGRVWQLYISYGDVGFIKRALIGTILTETGLNRLVANEYVFAIIAHHVAIMLLTALIAGFIIRNRIADRILIASVLLSPVLIIQSGYTTGALDVYVLIFAALNLFYVRNLWVFSLVLVLGIVTHELFAFTIPAQFIALAVRRQVDWRAWRWLAPLLPPAVAVAAALLLVFCFGYMHIGRHAYEQIMLAKLPHAAHKHELWSGYREVTQGIRDNAQAPAVMLAQLGGHWLFIALPLLYMGLVVYRAVRATDDALLKWLVLFSALVPMSAYFVATDFYRWVGMSANMALALTLVLAVHHPTRFLPRLQWLMLLFVFVAPFGSATIDRPFPMQQFLLEKLGYDQ